MAEIRHLENRHDVMFLSAEGGPIWIKFRRLQNDMSIVDCVNVVEIETRCRILIWRTFGRINGMSSQSHLPHCECCHLANSMSWLQSYVSHCRVLPPGGFNGMSLIPEPRCSCCHLVIIHCHDSRATCHIAGCKNSIRHIENLFSPYFIIFVFNSV